MTLRRMLIKFEVIYDSHHGELKDWDELDEIYRETIQGSASGSWSVEEVKDLTDKEAAELLEKQGSDPAFLLGEPEAAVDPEEPGSP